MSKDRESEPLDGSSFGRRKGRTGGADLGEMGNLWRVLSRGRTFVLFLSFNNRLMWGRHIWPHALRWSRRMGQMRN